MRKLPASQDTSLTSPLNGRMHPVAPAAARRCRARHGTRPTPDRVACAECCNAALEADEAFRVVFGLPQECPPDPSLVDDIAVELACRGAAVELTATEFGKAVWMLTKRGLSRRQIARRLGGVTVVDALGEPIAPGKTSSAKGSAA